MSQSHEYQSSPTEVPLFERKDLRECAKYDDELRLYIETAQMTEALMGRYPDDTDCQNLHVRIQSLLEAYCADAGYTPIPPQKLGDLQP